MDGLAPRILPFRGSCLAEPGFAEKYERGYNIFNPLNRYNSNNPYNPINEYNPKNPLNPINEYNPTTPFQPLNRSR